MIERPVQEFQRQDAVVKYYYVVMVNTITYEISIREENHCHVAHCFITIGRYRVELEE